MNTVAWAIIFAVITFSGDSYYRAGELHGSLAGFMGVLWIISVLMVIACTVRNW